ncbi:hypothetical protein Y032_0438g1472 [Ancylostoma ceylanicum]|uniref:Uncharacterized protein n=1 Tax=Ancylostoma ceylanicum TaxID=53326 RepID=A0A016X1J5_9BILA|nr:hypothetical protein Y032_0438g1472 [Ancylostoma ceylanicum]
MIRTPPPPLNTLPPSSHNTIFRVRSLTALTLTSLIRLLSEVISVLLVSVEYGIDFNKTVSMFDTGPGPVDGVIMCIAGKSNLLTNHFVATTDVHSQVCNLVTSN